MMLFFDTLTNVFFNFSYRFIHGLGFRSNKDLAKIHAVFVTSSFQGINLFLSIIKPLSVKFFDKSFPLKYQILGTTIILILNYKRYILSDRLDKDARMLFNVPVTYIIILLYFIVSIWLMLYMGDYVRDAMIQKNAIIAKGVN
ncbi:hypothetical protein H0I23_00885 [Cellulophaga sp. HaHaR_3_176]|uniref:hypothetical protein n=1 Tax=Cellulophaga sp. HaHaR_3_176 TaxID=1942464 RepID=UPI001C1FB719|nr:hypothetical protein [Cellulophaga sp. HaHaR_3_176]QWX84238.1 hypothetical protein H0I23_00885 [Cellulophaga sp. HaHaR_3_176]